MTTIWMSAKSYDEPDQYFEELGAIRDEFKNAGMRTTTFVPISNWTGGIRTPPSYLRVEGANEKKIKEIQGGYIFGWHKLSKKPTATQLKYSIEQKTGTSANHFLRGEKTESNYF